MAQEKARIETEARQTYDNAEKALEKEVRDAQAELDKLKGSGSPNSRSAQHEASQADAELARLQEEERLLLLQAGFDAAGIIEPTPFSDLASGGISLYMGDWVGAGLSLLSCIPYVGDALGKTAKGARLIKRLDALKGSIGTALARSERAKDLLAAAKRAEDALAAAGKKLDDLVAGKAAKLKAAKEAMERALAQAQEKAAEAIRKKRLDPKNYPDGIPGKPNCKYGTLVPKRGKWKDKDGNPLPKGEEGHGNWYYPEKEPHTQVVPYENGYPNFDKAQKLDPKTGQPIGGMTYPDGKVTIKDMSGDAVPNQHGVGGDFYKAQEEMRKKTGNEWWPGKSKDDPMATRTTPDGYVWHHSEDGKTMTLVERKYHDNSQTRGSSPAANHTGGDSIVTDPLF